MERLATMVVYLQYIIFPFCIFVVIYVIYSFCRTVVKRHINNRDFSPILKSGFGHHPSPGMRFAAAVASGAISKDNHINFAYVIDTNTIADGYLRFIGSSQNVREIGEIFGGGR